MNDICFDICPDGIFRCPSTPGWEIFPPSRWNPWAMWRVEHRGCLLYKAPTIEGAVWTAFCIERAAREGLYPITTTTRSFS